TSSVEPSVTTTDSSTCGANPGASASTTYEPTARAGRTNRPSRPVVVARITPVSTFRAVMLARGSTARDSSTTTPARSAPVAWLWPAAGRTTLNASARTATHVDLLMLGTLVSILRQERGLRRLRNRSLCCRALLRRRKRWFAQVVPPRSPDITPFPRGL